MNAMLWGPAAYGGTLAMPLMSDRHAPLPPFFVELVKLAVEIREVIADEGEEGRVALACAILNRHRRFGSGSGGGGGGAAAHVADFEAADRALCRAFAVACLVLAGDLDDPTDGATHFHHHRDNPKWARRATPKALIGQHLFYALHD
jgi:hypothetical protein